jgi:UDP-N-acetylglucosamine--N-acetylmuramyl-(pentapeptide) pyrophosphoryl-undecaprenol N-acetylglucosamine transferase
MRIAFAGGGTGGHVIPLIAVAEEVAGRGHSVVFFGTRTGLEARLVPAKGYPMEWIEIGGLMGLGLARKMKTLGQLPAATLAVVRKMKPAGPSAVFSMGGYVAGPTVLAALILGVPVVAMEPNAYPGLTNRRLGGFAARTLLAFEEAARYFPAGRSEVTGLPVRREFFEIPDLRRGERLNVLITGGSRGSRTLNRAARESWPLFARSGLPVRLVLQCGREEAGELQAEFGRSGLEGEVTPFLDGMAAAMARADLVVGRSGAGAVAELAAAGRPSVLAPFPFAAGQHQLRNAEAMVRAGASMLIEDREMSGERLFAAVRGLADEPGRLEQMGKNARRLARPGAAARAAAVLEEAAKAGGGRGRQWARETAERD